MTTPEKKTIRKRKLVSVRHNIDPWKMQDIGRNDIGTNFLDVSRSASDVEDGAFRTIFQEPPMEILVQETYRLFLFPHIAVNDLARVEIG
jgi:hypothetical protein